MVNQLRMNKISELRGEKNLSMQALADKVHPPTTASQINKLEKGHVELTKSWIKRLAVALDVEPAAIVPDLLGPEQKEKDRLWERFQQADESMKRMIATGLGLDEN